MASFEAIISGSSASLILLTGYITAIISFVRARKMKNPFLVWAGIFLICMGSFYLGTVTSFINLLISGSNIDTFLGGWLCYTVAPIGAAVSMYMGFTMIKPKLAKWITIIYAITAIPFWYLLYFTPAEALSSNIISNPPTIEVGGLIDLELLGLVRYFTIFYLGSFAVILIPCYIWLGKVSSGIMRKKAIFHIIGYAIFVVCGYIDSTIVMTPIIMVVVRVIMASAYIWTFLGFSLS